MCFTINQECTADLIKIGGTRKYSRLFSWRRNEQGNRVLSSPLRPKVMHDYYRNNPLKGDAKKAFEEISGDYRLGQEYTCDLTEEAFLNLQKSHTKQVPWEVIPKNTICSTNGFYVARSEEHIQIFMEINGIVPPVVILTVECQLEYLLATNADMSHFAFWKFKMPATFQGGLIKKTYSGLWHRWPESRLDSESEVG